ncbi:MAG: thioredoxin family protein [Gammaproteobacteria bacterium]|nr:thioredoxin family protein [Gammaproteobacteria bacterium]
MKIFYVLSLILFAMAPAYAQTSDAETGFFQQGFGDLTEELEIAREEGKKGVFIMFDDKDCPWCAKMKATVLNQPDVQKYYREFFRPVRVDRNGDEIITDFNGNEMMAKTLADNLRVRATPVMIFYDLQGKPMYRHTGATRSTQEFLWMGEYVAEGHYKTQRYTVYKRLKKKAGQ